VGSCMSGHVDVSPTEYRYELLTWPEINDAVAQRRVVILPVGSVEQHGRHLPLDVDVKLSSSVVYEAARRAPDLMVVLPPVSYGYCHHVMDFPGTINIEPSTFVKFLLDITRSVAYHGFKRIIIVNGHGSNHPLVEQVGRQTILQTDALCVTLSWWQLVADYWNKELRASAVPGGCAHACELETSVYLHVDAAHVRSAEITSTFPGYSTFPEEDTWHYVDLTVSSPATLVEWTSTYTQTGVIGDAEKATADKGRKAFEYAVERMITLVRWFRDRPHPGRRDHHTVSPTFPLPFGW
jgi:creatinine amidohydrolase